MASAWAKPGAWALDSEAHDAAAVAAEGDKGYESSDSAAAAAAAYQPPADFPSLSAAAATKPARKKKPQTVSLAEFTTGHAVSHGAAAYRVPSSKGPTSNEILALPTGPRERTAEELDRSSRGFGYSSSFGLGRGPARGSDEPRRSREPSQDMGPSRADEIDDWGAAKKFAPSPMPERRERSGGSFFDGPSRADESDSWASKKSMPLPSDGRRMSSGFDGPRERRGVGFEMFNREGTDSDTWGRKRDEAADAWGRKRDEGNGSGGRPRLVLQPRTVPPTNGNNGEHKEEQQQPKSKGSNPFGEARPREEVLAQKGQDWKEIDEKLESMKLKEMPPEVLGAGSRGFRTEEERTERTWRKADPAEAPPQRVEKSEEEVPDN